MNGMNSTSGSQMIEASGPDVSANSNQLQLAAQLLNAHAPEGERLAFINEREAEMLKSNGGLGVPAAGGVPSYKGNVEAPPPRNYGQETRDTLQAQIDLAPQLAATEARYRPVYTALDLADLNYMLRGSDAIPQISFDQPVSRTTTTESANPREGLGGGKGGTEASPNRTNMTTVEEQYMPAMLGQQKGVLSLYEEDIAPSLSRIEAAERNSRIAGEMDAIGKYAGGVSRTLREATGNAPLLDELNRQALEEIKSGARLDPSLRREVQQSIRAGQAARGMGYGMRDLADESTMTALQAEQLRRNRQAFAQSMVGMNQATGGDPFMAILGRPSQVFQATQGVGAQAYGMSQSMGPKLFNPESQYAADIYNQNYQGQLAARTATAANKSAILGGAIGAVGSIGGGFLGNPGLFGK